MWEDKKLHYIALCPFHASSETTPSSLIMQQQRTKKTNDWHLLKNRRFFLARVALSRELCSFSASSFSTRFVYFPLKFCQIISPNKEISGCLPGTGTVRKKRRFNHDGFVLSGFYQVLSFTKVQLWSSIFYVNSL